MDFNDLDEARVLHAALADIFVAHAGGREDPEALARVEKLCDGASSAVDDVECRVAIRGVKSYAMLFFSDDAHLGIDTGSLAPVDYLRLRIHNCLSAFRGRLGAIESSRLHVQRVEFELRRSRPRSAPPCTPSPPTRAVSGSWWSRTIRTPPRACAGFCTTRATKSRSP